MQWVAQFAGARGDVGADAREHVVAAEQQVAVAVDERKMSGCVAGCPHRFDVPSGEIESITVGENYIGALAFGEAHEFEAGGFDHLGRCAEPGEIHAPCFLVGGDILRGEVPEGGGVGGVHRDDGAGRLLQAGCQTEMVGMQVGDRRVAHVGDVVAGRGDTGDEGVPRLLGVHTEVDQSETVVECERIRKYVSQRVLRHRDRDRPQSRTHFLDGRQYSGGPCFTLDGAEVLGDDHGVVPSCTGANSLRSVRLRIFPLALRGSSSTKWMCRGFL